MLNGKCSLKRSLFLAALAVSVGATPGAAMTPPMMAVQVGPGSPLRGLGSATADGLGVYLTTRQSTRDTRRQGGTDVSNPDDEKNESLRTSLLLDYRLTRNLSAALSIPHVYNKASYLDPVTRQKVTQKVNGIGDVGVFGRYSFWKDRLVDPRREWLGILGLELGTGSITEKDGQGARLAATLQPGSGTTDVIAGTALVWALPILSLYGDATYRLNGSRAYTFGNALAVNAGANVPFANDKLSFLGEINGEFSSRDESDFVGAPGRNPDGTVQNTGGETVYFSPALQWRPGGTWAFTAGVQLPVYQNFRGTQLKSDVNYNLGAYARFGGNS
ncbi:MAG: hypothetical protein HY548_05445 [Elusimicrobia bacterium]|nr:hypothetical protein [Elusimicrobiota bacterium]